MSLAASGCFVEEDLPTEDEVRDAIDDHMSSGSGSKAPGKASTATNKTTGNAHTAAPAVANLTVDVRNGTAPLTVVFNITGNGTSWVLDLGDNSTANGTSLPATFEHTYEAAGVYVANLTVIGPGGNATSSVPIEVLGDAASEPMAPMAFSGSCTTEVSHDVSHTFTVTPGQARIFATIDIGGGGIDIDWALLDPSGAEKDAGTSFTIAGEDPLETTEPDAGTWSIQVTCFLGAVATYDIDVVFTNDA